MLFYARLLQCESHMLRLKKKEIVILKFYIFLVTILKNKLAES